MAAPGYNFHSYNTASPNESPAESSMTVAGNDYSHSSYLTQSHPNDQYFNTSLDDSLGIAYGISNPNAVSHRMHAGLSNPMPSQSFGPFEGQNLQVVQFSSLIVLCAY